jgi:hypothetical protein
MFKLKAALPFVLSVFLISFGASAAAKLEVTSPQDKTISWSTRAGIDGTSLGAKEVDLNGTKVDLDKAGEFNAVALLRPGKNVILVTASYPGAQKLTKNIRMLRLVTCDDIEKLFKGRQHWAKSQIVTLLTLGVIEGYPDNVFEPGNSLSRGEFATWLARAKQLKTPAVEKDVFFDVPKEHWRAPYIKAVVDAGYMTGVAADRFGISEKISRSDAVAVVAKANNLAPLKLSKSPFYDVPADYKDAAYIYSAYNKGWIIGYPGRVRKYEPNKEMARGEIAVLLSRLSNIKELRSWLYDFEKGYTSRQFCRISTRPVIKEIAVEPGEIAADGKTPVKLSAVVADAQGAADISQVWADLTPLGGPGYAKMSTAADGKYEISFIMTTETVPGEKGLTVRALDKSGLESETSTVRLLVIK